MADALFLRILDGIVLALNTARPADVPEVTKRRVVPDEIPSAASMAVFLGDESREPPRGGPNSVDPLARRRIQIAVQCVAPTDDPAKLDLIVEPMLKWATSVLGTARPAAPLVGLVHYLLETQTLRRATYQDRFVMNATQVYDCSYQTQRDDLTVTA